MPDKFRKPLLQHPHQPIFTALVRFAAFILITALFYLLVRLAT